MCSDGETGLDLYWARTVMCKTRPYHSAQLQKNLDRILPDSESNPNNL